MSNEANKTFNEKNSDFYDLEYFLSLEYRYFSGANGSHVKNILKNLQGLDLKGKRVLDVGCGGGFFTQKIAELGAEAKGCDYSQYAIKFAKDRYPGLDIVERSAYEIDALGISNLDLITAFDVVEHLEHPEIFFEKAFKILNPREGKLMITTDNENYLFQKTPFNHLRNLLTRTSSSGRAYRFIGRVEAYRRQFKNYHQSHISPAGPEVWIGKIKEAGFQIEKVSVYSSIAIPILDFLSRFLPIFTKGDHQLIIAKK